MKSDSQSKNESMGTNYTFRKEGLKLEDAEELEVLRFGEEETEKELGTPFDDLEASPTIGTDSELRSVDLSILGECYNPTKEGEISEFRASEPTTIM
jgi:hypothetical protein